ncbi:MAG TPA: hypothetical protein VGX91_02200 [Candidatus Cybelea sp.]|jgi:WD40 repeat protein|nr:hypothetical protein [Candidatus Cybelea sp.]
MRASVIFAASLLLAGCGGSQPPGFTPLAIRENSNLPPPAAKNLYVANAAGSITVYAPGTEKPLRTISDNAYEPLDMTFDSKGYLYVVNGLNSAYPATVPVYAPGGIHPVRIITNGDQRAGLVAISPKNGNAYVANEDTVTVYQAGTTKLIQTIGGIADPESLAIDRSGQIYVGEGGVSGSGPFTMSIFAPGASKPVRTITSHLNRPVAIAFDAKNYLYVANAGTYGSFLNTVAVFQPNSTKLDRTITDGVHQPMSLAFDSDGNLYVGNLKSNTVTVYSGNPSKLVRTVSQGISDPESLAFGSHNFLNVANYTAKSRGSVTEYPPGSGKLNRTITYGLYGPFCLAFGP